MLLFEIPGGSKAKCAVLYFTFKGLQVVEPRSRNYQKAHIVESTAFLSPLTISACSGIDWCLCSGLVLYVVVNVLFNSPFAIKNNEETKLSKVYGTFKAKCIATIVDISGYINNTDRRNICRTTLKTSIWL